MFTEYKDKGWFTNFTDYIVMGACGLLAWIILIAMFIDWVLLFPDTPL